MSLLLFATEPPNLSPSDQAGLINAAQAMIGTYTHSDQTRSLLLDCMALDLSSDECRRILTSANPQALPADLVVSELKRNSISPAEQLDLVALLFQIPNLKFHEKADIKLLAVQPLTQQILQARNFEALK